MMLEAAARIWPVALAAIPLAVLVTVLCRILPLRPSTRHTLFLAVVLFLLLAPFLPAAPNVATDVSGWRAAWSSGLTTKGDGAELPDSASIESTHEIEPVRDAARTDPTTSTSQPLVALRRDDDPIGAARPRWNPVRAKANVPTRSATGTTPKRDEARGPKRDEARGPKRDEARGPKRDDDETTTAPPTLPPQTEPDGHAAVAGPSPAPSADPPADPAAVTDRTPSLASAASQFRSAIAAIPPLPAALWLAGSVFVALVTVTRFARLGRILRRAEPAPSDIRATVVAAANELGLRDIPRTLVVDARISPLVTVIPRRHLVIPRALWAQLDGPGRRAVILHELAHLSRRDHWVVWIDVLVAVFYWWHPVAWWVRRRLCEEADLSCDAWVTTLLPTARRAYATALLESRVFASAPAPSAALGASNIRKKRFARRLTMVMSHTVTPRRTFAGVTLACSLGAIGWIVAPAFACPPSQESSAGDSHVQVLFTSNPCPPDCQEECCAGDDTPDDVSTFELFLKNQEIDNISLERHLGELEGQIEVFAVRLAEWAANLDESNIASLEANAQNLADQLSSLDFDNDQLSSLSEGVAYLLNNDQTQRAIGTILAFCDDDDKPATRPSPPKAPSPPKVTYEPIGQAIEQVVSSADNRISRSYELPEGKLEAITELMSLEDVPILISTGENAITVHATMEQHMVFGAFVTMINAEDERKAYALSSNKLEALTELMVRGDVPVMVSPGDEEITVLGDSLEQLIFGAFVKMIAPAPGPDFQMTAPSASASDSFEFRSAPAADTASTYERRARAEVARMAELRSVYSALRHEADSCAERCQQMEAEAEALEEKLEDIEEYAEKIEEKAEEVDPEERIEYVHKYNELMLEAQQLRNLARLREVEAGSMEAHMDEIEAKIEAIAEEIEAIADELEDAADEFEDDDHDEDDDNDEDDDHDDWN